MTTFIQHVQNTAGAPGHWPDEFLAWYEPAKWLSEERAAAVFLGQKFAAQAAPAGEWRGLTGEERAAFVNEICEYGTGFVAPLFSLAESLEDMLKARNAPAAPAQQAEPEMPASFFAGMDEDYRRDAQALAAEPNAQALRWATELAQAMARKHYPEVPQWEVLPDLVGVISQIDNMTTGLVRAPAADAQWQPIETAPKNANTIWVACADALTPMAGPAHWCGEWRAGTADDWEDEGAAEKWGTYPAPTHWMPLPAAPKP